MFNVVVLGGAAARRFEEKIATPITDAAIATRLNRTAITLLPPSSGAVDNVAESRVRAIDGAADPTAGSPSRRDNRAAPATGWGAGPIEVPLRMLHVEVRLHAELVAFLGQQAQPVGVRGRVHRAAKRVNTWMP
jgi:hypothetical protein